MENKPKKSKALIITIIVIILLLIAGYLIYKNRDVFGVKTSATIAKIFSPLISSNNSKNLNKIEAQAGEDIKKGDSVSVFGTGSNNNPIVMKATNGNVFGYANQDITNGNMGEIVLNNGNTNTFWDSFSGFLGGLLGGNNGGTTPPPATNSCTNGATNYPMCTTNNGDLCINNATNPPLCTIIGGLCINNATNPPLCTIIGGICVNGKINPPDCTTTGDEGKTDLIANIVTPTSAIIKTPTPLSSIITNIGGGGTGSSFSSLFTIVTISTGESIEASVIVPSLETHTGNIATISHSFSSTGEYSIRACADKSSSSDTGTVAESDEDNNCGPWMTFTVTDSSLPIPSTLPQCSDGIDNDNDGKIDSADSNCHMDGDLSKEYIPTHDSEIDSPVTSNNLSQCSDGIDNDNDGKIDSADSNCHIDGDLSKEYISTHDSEIDSPVTPYVNECLLIDTHPLSEFFTPAEKSKLAELLRKFYLIAPNLKTEDDINIAYSEITQYNNFSDHLGVLIKQCYTETSDPSYTGPKTRYENPWYKYNTLRGSYIDSTFDCKYVSGWFSGTGSDGKDCDTYNQRLYTPQTPASCTNALNFSSNNSVYREGLNNKCVWNTGVYVRDMEKILNVW